MSPAGEKAGAALPAADREIVLTRVFDAPRELVFRAWTDPDMVSAWWGPHGFTCTFVEMDVRPGGTWRKCMRSPAGQDYWRHGVYTEVVPPERLVFSYYSDDVNSDPEREMMVTVVFEEQRGQTRMTFRQAEFATVAERDAHRFGWTQALERCAAYVSKGH